MFVRGGGGGCVGGGSEMVLVFERDTNIMFANVAAINCSDFTLF